MIVRCCKESCVSNLVEHIRDGLENEATVANIDENNFILWSPDGSFSVDFSEEYNWEEVGSIEKIVIGIVTNHVAYCVMGDRFLDEYSPPNFHLVLWSKRCKNGFCFRKFYYGLKTSRKIWRILSIVQDNQAWDDQMKRNKEKLKENKAAAKNRR